MASPSSNVVEWQDETGRYFRVQLLGSDPDPAHGYLIGPPLELWNLSLPDATKLKLHNELYYRGILTEQDFERNRREVEAALKAALRLDVGHIREAYRGDGNQADC